MSVIRRHASATSSNLLAIKYDLHGAHRFPSCFFSQSAASELVSLANTPSEEQRTLAPFFYRPDLVPKIIKK